MVRNPVPSFQQKFRRNNHEIITINFFIWQRKADDLTAFDGTKTGMDDFTG
jgi:hypothetical protein